MSPSGQPVAVPVARIPRWRAPKPDGVGHAYLSRRDAALCGARNQEERYDWPRRSKCAACVELEGRP